MTRRLSLILAPALAAACLVPVAGAAASPSGRAAPPVHEVAIDGEGISTFPRFDADIERYAVRTSGTSNGTLTVRATTSDPAGVVSVDGRRVRDGVSTVTGLTAGEEVTVFIDDAAGRSVHSFFYLPADFPELSRVALPERADDPSPGHVLLTLGLWTEPSPFFETAVDANGVPVMVHTTANSMDLTRQPNGNYSVARGRGPGGAEIVELDGRFEEVGRYRTVGLEHTDGHDAVLLDDGSRYLMAYEPDRATGKTDAILQHVAADGSLLFEWNSADHVDIAAETVVGEDPDYAHVNSIQVMSDGDLLVSFRHLSSVLKVARVSHDGYAAGEVIWRLGGRASDFTFRDTAGAPDGGPCAQHTARELPDGNIVVFDNGAWSLNPLCIDPSAPEGPPVPRTPTRIAEWSLDEAGGVATMVRDHRVGGRYAIFAGSVQPLEDGRSMVGWASSRDAVASELDAQGDVVWELEAVDRPEYFSYRAFKTEVDDQISPQVGGSRLPRGGTYVVGQEVAPVLHCTDRGGSTLRTCEATPIDTSSPGSGTSRVTATDGAGNRSAVELDYEVSGPRVRPDAQIRRQQDSGFVGDDVYGPARGQTARARVGARGTAVAVVVVQNDGTRAQRYRLGAVTGTREFSVATRQPGTRRRSPVIAPGESWRVALRVRPRAVSERGDRARVLVRARPLGQARPTDAVAFVVRRR